MVSASGRRSFSRHSMRCSPIMLTLVNVRMRGESHNERQPFAKALQNERQLFVGSEAEERMMPEGYHP